MAKKNLLMILLAIVLAAVYVIWFTDWFRPARVQIFHTSRNVRQNFRRNAGSGAMPSLIFGLNRPLRLTELKVVPLAALETNKNVLPLWHLVSDSNSVPLKSFSYGQFIGGMHPALKGVRPEPLETNVPYRIVINAGKITGEHPFELK